jgi:predicted RNase H-like HicB family nuclease
MRYSVAIHKEDDSCFGITVPDIEGCFSAGDTLDEALENTQEAISGHLEILADEGILAPKASPIDDFIGKPDYAGVTWAYIDIDVSAFLGKTEKATVTLPKLLMTKIDFAVSNGFAKSRSAFLAESAMKALSAQTGNATD